MSRPIACDVAVGGAGTASLEAYHAAKAAGANVRLIEAGPGGTPCARYGCIPSKLLLVAARSARDARAGSGSGVKAGEPVIDGKAVMVRVRRHRDHSINGVLEEVAAIPSSDKLQGWARFTGYPRA